MMILRFVVVESMLGGMSPPSGSTEQRATFGVSDELFQIVYDSPRSLPGKHVWLTPDEDVRELERVLGLRRTRSARRCG